MGQPKHWLGLDIGGANLKAAMATGYADERAFPLWQRPERLADALANQIAAAPPHRGLAVTMTGELADCYSTKAEGVQAIVAAVEKAAAGKPARYYSLAEGGAFVDASQAADDWLALAASNWHALATACCFAREESEPPVDLVIDVGSTTTDIVPTVNGYPATTYTSDTQRLLAGQLLYQGAGRTPICAVVDRAPFRGQMCPVAAELFATTVDVALLLDYTAECESTDTADGRPFTKACSVARLGRMLCADPTEFTLADALALAKYVCEQMELRFVDAMNQVLATCDHPVDQIILAGSGAWLARAALLRAGRLDAIESLAVRIGMDASRCAPAWAVATLQDEWSRT